MDRTQENLKLEATAEKKPYRSPNFNEFGDLSKLTQGPGNSVADVASGMMLGKGP